MKLKKLTFLLGFLVFPSAYSAVEVNSSVASKMRKDGVVSISSFNRSPSEAVEKIKSKAIQAGATHFRITSFGDASN